MICKKCGMELPDIAKFCYSCGTVIDNDLTENKPEEKNETSDVENNTVEVSSEDNKEKKTDTGSDPTVETQGKKEHFEYKSFDVLNDLEANDPEEARIEEEMRKAEAAREARKKAEAAKADNNGSPVISTSSEVAKILAAAAAARAAKAKEDEEKRKAQIKDTADAAKKAEQEALAKMLRDAQSSQQKAAEDNAEAEAAKKAAEEAEAAKKAAEEAEAARKAAEEAEAARKAAEEAEAAKKAAEEAEAARKAAEEAEAAKKAAEEAEAAKKAAEEAEAARKAAEEAEAAKKAAEEAEALKKAGEKASKAENKMADIDNEEVLKKEEEEAEAERKRLAEEKAKAVEAALKRRHEREEAAKASDEKAALEMEPGSSEEGEIKTVDFDNTGVDGEDVKDEEKPEEEEPETPFVYAIMKNPDYVPPEVEEIKPFYEDHVNYEEIRQQRNDKMEKRMQVVSVVVGVLAAVGVIAFGIYKVMSIQKYKNDLAEADKKFEAAAYQDALDSYKSLWDYSSADQEELAIKIFDTYIAMDERYLGYQYLLTVKTALNSEKVYGLVAENIDATPKPTKSPEEAGQPQVVDDPSKVVNTVPATQTPAPATQDPETATQTPAPATQTPAPATQTPDDDPQTIDVTAYEEMFAELYELNPSKSAGLSKVLEIAGTDGFKSLLKAGKIIYYSDAGFGTVQEEFYAEKAIVILPGENALYFGSISEGVMEGDGVYIRLLDGSGYNRFVGSFKNGLASGEGKFTETKDDLRLIYRGSFADDMFNGTMDVSVMKDSVETGKGRITFEKGKPVVMKDKDGNPIELQSGGYSIGSAVNGGTVVYTFSWDGERVYKVR